MTLLLRHKARQERIPISDAGWVRMDHLLGWQGMRRYGLGDGEDAVKIVVAAVDWDRREGKGRFGLGMVERDGGEGEEEGEKGKGEGTDQQTTAGTTSILSADTKPATATATQIDPANETETDRIINLVLHPTNTTSIPTPSKFQIRATQGHSLAITDTESLLTEITLNDNNNSIPDTVVHGTFYGAWNKILRSGGLKSMGRGFVHCATGPRLGDVLPGEVGGAGGAAVDKSLVENKVRSGMRSDAQILIYIDIRRSLEAGMKWWRSENGVLLTEGIAVDGGDAGGTAEKILPLSFFDVVVEIKKGVGVLWRDGEVVKELPEELARMAVPRGKDRDHSARGGGRGGGRGRGRGRGS